MFADERGYLVTQMVWDEVEVDEAEEKTAAMTAAQITGTDIGSL